MNKKTASIALSVLLLVLMVGCSGAQPPVLPGRTHQVLGAQSSAMRPLVYFSDSDNSNIYVFNRGGLQVGMLRNLAHPQGLFVDSSHQLWVANFSNSDVLLFPRGHIYPVATYNDPKQSPMDVALCPNGLVFVSNLGGSISVYAQDKPNPIRTLSDPNEYNNVDIACDAANNVFTTIELGPSGPGAVDEYAGGVQSGLKSLIIKNLGFAYGIAVTARKTLLVGDQQTHTVAEYTEYGKPTNRSLSTGSDTWFGLALGLRGELYAADYSQMVGIAVTFPGGTILHQYVPTYVGSGSYQDLIVGVAYDAGE